jgi:predicted phage terminase large subunit-like protein
MNFTDRDFLNAALRSDFPTFLHRCMLTLNPGAPFLENWHIEAIAYQLERVRSGEITRLIINLPPRSLKSIMVSVAFPAFLLGHDPRRKIFGISYGADLAAKHAADFRSIVQSRWYRQAFPNMQIARMADSDVSTTSRGYRKATSVSATLTGLGGDCFIIDDPLKPVDAQSDAQRNGLNDWFSNTLSSRLDNKATGVIIVVMQRVHLNDLTGHLLENSAGWELLNLPAIAEAEETVAIGEGKLHLRRAGEALHPEREPLEVLENLRRELGSDVFAAQYQQSPVPPGGAMIRREWLRYYDKAPERSYRAKIIQSWDTAAKDGAQNDWSVCTTWMLADNHYYLIDLTRGRYEYPRLKETAVALAQKHRPNCVLIEDASTGTALAQELKRVYFGGSVRLVPVERDKIGRLYVNQAKFEAGLVIFPKGARFLPELEAELLVFPQGKTDDQVDSITQALSHRSGYDTTLRWVG